MTSSVMTREMVPVEHLLDRLPDTDRQDRFIVKVLQRLRQEGHKAVERVVVPSWAPILSCGDDPRLYLVLAGNASVAFAREVAGDPRVFSRTLSRISGSPSPVSKLNEIALPHPIVLSKGDLIGEFEYVQRMPIANHVISGTFFKTPQTRGRLQTILLRLPEASAFAASLSLHVTMEKLVLINHILLPAIHQGGDRINNILACCFAGLLPVYRAFYRGKHDGEPIVAAPNVCPGAREETGDSEFVCLGRLDPARDPVGIEISTLYLLRCFGFSSRDSITADLNGFDMALYSEDHARRAQDGRERGRDREMQMMERYWKQYSLGTESMLFFLRGITAAEFCASYGVDSHHGLFSEASAGLR